MKLNTCALICICIILLFTACKKDDDSGTPNQTQLTTSIVGSWKVQSSTYYVYSSSEDSTYDLYAQYKPCAKDDRRKFNADKTMTYLYGTLKCDPNEPASVPAGTYILDKYETELLMIANGDTFAYDVMELNTTTLKLRIYESDPDLGRYSIFEITYLRQ